MSIRPGTKSHLTRLIRSIAGRPVIGLRDTEKGGGGRKAGGFLDGQVVFLFFSPLSLHTKVDWLVYEHSVFYIFRPSVLSFGVCV